MNFKKRLLLTEMHFWIIVMMPLRANKALIERCASRFEKRVMYLIKELDAILNGESK